MLNQIVSSVIENIEDKSLVPLIAERANGAISERGLRNTPTAKTEEKIILSVEINQRNVLIKAGLTEDEANEWFQHRPKSLYAGLVYDSQTNSTTYPETIALAAQVDALSARIFDAYPSGDFKRVRTILEEAAFLSSEYWTFDSGQNLKDFDVHSERDIQEILKTVSWNCMLSILALWDIEFGAQYFKKYQPRSIFELVCPKADVTAKRRDMFWYPYRRLLSLLSCLGHFITSDAWPEAPLNPKLLVKTCNIDETDLVKWRRGTKRITFRQFMNLWGDLATRKGEIAEIPNPVYIAATFWHLSLTRQTSSERTLILASDHYLEWWVRHWKKYEAKGGLKGATPWPQCFTQI